MFQLKNLTNIHSQIPFKQRAFEEKVYVFGNFDKKLYGNKFIFINAFSNKAYPCFDTAKKYSVKKIGFV